MVDTYGAVKNEDSEQVFWTSQLEFATEVVVIFERHLTTNNNSCCGCCSDTGEQLTTHSVAQPATNDNERPNDTTITDDFPAATTAGQPTQNVDAQPATITNGQPVANANEQPLVMYENFMFSCWEAATWVFRDKRDIYQNNHGERFSSSVLLFLRFFALLPIVIWVMLGAITAGLLWPPQVRKGLWGSSKDDGYEQPVINAADQPTVNTEEQNLCFLLGNQ